MNERDLIVAALREEAARSYMFKLHWEWIANWIERGDFLKPVSERRRP